MIVFASRKSKPYRFSKYKREFQLNWCYVSDRVKAVEQLIKNGANVNASNNGTTALMVAAKNGIIQSNKNLIQN